MNGIPLKTRKDLGALLASRPQCDVMGMIPQFATAEIGHFASPPCHADDFLGVLVLNMERGVHLDEITDFLQECPHIRPYDVILTNELDDGCVRSGNRNVAHELAAALHFDYAWGLEFIELTDDRNEKGYHGNAVFSRWPILRAGVIRLPEQYNWYFDRQKRIGGRMAVFAELAVGGQKIGVVSVHLENRTNSDGRRAQMDTILESVARELPGMPLLIGGDLNTNTFDGRDTEDIGRIAGDAQLRRRCLEDVFQYETALSACTAEGYRLVPEDPVVTRRKPLPGGGFLPLRLDWIAARDVRITKSRMISTAAPDFSYASPGSALSRFTGTELTDHNAVWALCSL